MTDRTAFLTPRVLHQIGLLRVSPTMLHEPETGGSQIPFVRIFCLPVPSCSDCSSFDTGVVLPGPAFAATPHKFRAARQDTARVRNQNGLNGLHYILLFKKCAHPSANAGTLADTKTPDGYAVQSIFSLLKKDDHTQQMVYYQVGFH